MQTKMIIFDKDGTLLDFDAFWVTVTRHALLALLNAVDAPAAWLDDLLLSIGVKDDVTDLQSVLASGTYRQMGQALYKVLAGRGIACEEESIIAATADAYLRYAHTGLLRPTCDGLRSVLNAFRRQGCLLSIVTTDGPAITQQCLQELGIADCFCEVCTDDGHTPHKPDPAVVHWLCEKYGLHKSEVVMVGDTLTDVRFARNGGIRVIDVAKDEGNRAFLSAHADAAVPDVSYVADVLMHWECAK